MMMQWFLGKAHLWWCIVGAT